MQQADQSAIEHRDDIAPSRAVKSPIASKSTTVQWASTLDKNTMQKYFPEKARAEDVTGRAELECTVQEDGIHVKCHTLFENPEGYEFGNASVKALEDVGRIDAAYGDSSGMTTKIVLVWEAD